MAPLRLPLLRFRPSAAGLRGLGVVVVLLPLGAHAAFYQADTSPSVPLASASPSVPLASASASVPLASAPPAPGLRGPDTDGSELPSSGLPSRELPPCTPSPPAEEWARGTWPPSVISLMIEPWVSPAGGALREVELAAGPEVAAEAAVAAGPADLAGPEVTPISPLAPSLNEPAARALEQSTGETRVTPLVIQLVDDATEPWTEEASASNESARAGEKSRPAWLAEPTDPWLE